MKIRERIKEYLNKEECQHYWLIDGPNGPRSQGVCKYCGATREFFNAIPDFTTTRRHPNPFNLPKMTEVKVDKKSRS
jgi:hypothetical protein